MSPNSTLRAFSRADLATALAHGSLPFSPGERCTLEGGLTTFVGCVAEALGRISRGLGPGNYRPLDVATHNLIEGMLR